MTYTPIPYIPLGRVFGFLTKQYIGILSKKMEDSPVDRYYFPLYIIGKNSGKISQQQLADQLLTDKVSLVRILDNLAEDGLIERKVNPNDRRQHLLCVTEKGQPWIEEIEKCMHETDELFIQLVAASNPDIHSQLLEMMHSAKELIVQDIELFYNKPQK